MWFSALSICSMSPHLPPLKVASTLLFSEAKETSTNEAFQGILRLSVACSAVQCHWNSLHFQLISLAISQTSSVIDDKASKQCMWCVALQSSQNVGAVDKVKSGMESYVCVFFFCLFSMSPKSKTLKILSMFCVRFIFCFKDRKCHGVEVLQLKAAILVLVLQKKPQFWFYIWHHTLRPVLCHRTCLRVFMDTRPHKASCLKW